ncbi:MAG: hypothetical protein AAF621_07625, partial [Pseudomonadota bacterium]
MIIMVLSLSTAFAENALSPDTAPACRADAPPTDDHVFFRAQKLTYDDLSNSYTASGQVEVIYQYRRVTADHIIYDLTSGTATATGDVTLYDTINDAYLFADQIVLDKDFSTGVGQSIFARKGEYLKLAASRIERPNKDTIIFHDAVFTPCGFKQDENPLWQLRAAKVTDDATAEDVIYHDATFEVFGTPVAYLPELTYPRPTVERRTGILPPEVDFDTSNGLGISTPYFFEIDKSRVLTMRPTIFTENAPLLQNDYRQRTNEGFYEAQTAFTISELR